MTNQIQIEGRVLGKVMRFADKEGRAADFTLYHEGRYQFQVISLYPVSHDIIDGSLVTVCGKLLENEGDCHIQASSVELDKQIEMVFQ